MKLAHSSPFVRPHSLLICLFALIGSAILAVPAIAADASPLIGEWVRPDGGYRLTVLAVNADGTVKAEYHNPAPIEVEAAKAGEADGKPTLFVELGGENYKHSTYNLTLQGDRLVGKYHQAVLQKTYDIFFVRVAKAGRQ
jgi:hypothetical protein